MIATQPLTQPLELFGIFRGQKQPQRAHSRAGYTLFGKLINFVFKIQTLFQVVSQFFKFFNFNGGDSDNEKRLVGPRRAAPQAKIQFIL